MHDLVIRGGTVVDGTGSAARSADVAVDGDRIVAIEDVAAPGREEIDARGLVVTPGFVDPHTHLDAQLCWDPTAAPSSLHGVTTVLMGMCGFGIAPCAVGGGDYLLRSLEVVEEIPFESSSLGVGFEWSTWPEYLEFLESRPTAVNFGGMVPHSALRCFVMGDRARETTATDDELALLASELRRSLEGGALGFATSRGTNHLDAFGNPVPSRFSDDRELQRLVIECGERPWQINLATKVSPVAQPMLDEVAEYASWTEAAGARLSWSHFFAEPTEEVWRAVLDHNRSLNERCVVRPQVSPGPFTTTVRFDGPRLAAVTGWKSVMQGFASLDRADRLERLADPDVRAALRDAPATYASMPLAQRPRFGVPPAYDSWMIIDTARPELLGLTLSDAAARAGVAPSDLLCDLALEDDLRVEVQAPIVNGDWRAAAALSADDCTLIGLGDSGAHMSTVTNFVYPTDLLARLVRDEGAFSIEHAVQRITSEPARFFGVPARGELRAGNFADVCVIDLDRLSVGRLEVRRDLPGGAPRLFRGAEGYAAVVANGAVTVRDDALTGATPGRAVRPSDA